MSAVNTKEAALVDMRSQLKNAQVLSLLAISPFQRVGSTRRNLLKHAKYTILDAVMTTLIA
jgi:hypothetical protein